MDGRKSERGNEKNERKHHSCSIRGTNSVKLKTRAQLRLTSTNKLANETKPTEDLPIIYDIKIVASY